VTNFSKIIVISRLSHGGYQESRHIKFWKCLQPLCFLPLPLHKSEVINTEYIIVVLLLSTHKNSFDLDFEGRLSAKEAAACSWNRRIGLFLDKKTFYEYVHVWIQIKWNWLASPNIIAVCDR